MMGSFGDFLNSLTPLNYVLILGIMWLSGVFIWLIKKFVASFEHNTRVLTKVCSTMENMDHKLDTAADRDMEFARVLERIAAKQETPPNLKVVVPEERSSHNGQN